MTTVAPAAAERPLVLTLDIGTSSTRAMVFDRLARPVDGLQGRREYEVRTTPDGGAELDADAVLAGAVAAVDAALAAAGELAGEIAAVATCTLVPNLLASDGAGRAVTPCYTWADTRSGPYVEQLRARLDYPAYHARTGCMLHASYTPAKLLWLADTRPELFARPHRWLTLGEYVYLRLTGRAGCSYSVASWSGLLDQTAMTWDATTLALLPITADQLAPLVDIGDGAAGLTAEYAARWPALARARWLPAVGDGATSNIGSGCSTRRRVAVMVGTSGALRVVAGGPAPAAPDGLWLYRANRDRFVLGGALSNGGNLLDWLTESLVLPDYDTLQATLATRPPDGHGLTMLPFLAGERSPGWASHATGAIVGLRLHTRPLDILQAGLEAVAYRFAAIYDLVRGVLPGADEIIASGGALLNSPAWMQIIADVLGLPVTASGEAEASSRGAALLALEVLGGPAWFDVPAALGRRYDPDPGRHERYRQARARQARLYAVLIRGEGGWGRPGQ
jgi:gluconokinase